MFLFKQNIEAWVVDAKMFKQYVTVVPRAKDCRLSGYIDMLIQLYKKCMKGMVGKKQELSLQQRQLQLKSSEWLHVFRCKNHIEHLSQTQKY